MPCAVHGGLQPDRHCSRVSCAAIDKHEGRSMSGHLSKLLAYFAGGADISEYIHIMMWWHAVCAAL